MSRFEKVIRRSTSRRAALVAGLSVAAVGLVPVVGAATASADTLRLNNPTFTGSPGAQATGSYIRIQVPGGPYVPNTSSTNPADNTKTPLYRSTVSGTAGLEVGNGFQNEANVAAGSGIVDPVNWNSAPFDVYTTDTDVANKKSSPNAPVGDDFPEPTLVAAGGAVDDLTAWSIDYGNSGAGAFDYNQGARRVSPASSSPNTNLTITSYNALTGAIVLDWTSQINGDPVAYPGTPGPPVVLPGDADPFNGLIGQWHIEGVLS